MGPASKDALARKFDFGGKAQPTMKDKKCPNMAGCAMFPLLSLAGTLKTWQIRYCSGEYETCERFKRTQRGLPVAPDLMPNGVTLGERRKS